MIGFNRRMDREINEPARGNYLETPEVADQDELGSSKFQVTQTAQQTASQTN